MSVDLAKNCSQTLSPNKTKHQNSKFYMNGNKIVGSKSQVDLKNQLYRDLPVCSECVYLLFSHPGWGPAMAEIQTNSYRKNER